MLEAILKSKKELYKSGPIELIYHIINEGKTPVIFFDRNFLKANLINGKEVELYTTKDLIRSDLRESISEYKTIKPGGKITHEDEYEFKNILSNPPLPWDLIIQYRVTRNKERCNYYNRDYSI